MDNTQRLLVAGHAVPHFDVVALDGTRVNYAKTIWQRSHLLLIRLQKESAPEAAYLDRLRSLACSAEGDVICVVTRDPIPGLDPCGALVADRWGEVHFAAPASSIKDLPAPDELSEWVEHVRSRCPECEGEAR